MSAVISKYKVFIIQVVHSETGKTLMRGETGEVCIRGPQVMKGYFNNEKATKEMVDNEGWLHTGSYT